MTREMKDSGIEWIGEIPKEWEIKKMKSCTNIIMGQSPDSNDILNNGKIPFMQGNREFGKKYPHPTLYCENCKKYSRIGDILLSVRAPIGAINEADKVYGIGRGLCSIRADDINKSYLKYYLMKSIDDLKVYSNGSTFEAITVDVLQNFYIALPLNNNEQERIVWVLDRKCEKADTVLEKTRASIEEYKKLKQAVITRAVTKGVRGNREMKDSRIEWIEKIPAEWEERRIKTLFDLREEKNYSPLEEVNLISLYTDLGVVQHSDLEKTTGNKASNADGYKKVYKDDIVVNIILCWMGAIGCSEYEGVTSPAYDIYIPQNDVLSKFYHYYFRTKGFSGDCYQRGRGIMAMRWRTYSEQFRDIRVVYPPLEEQQEIVDYLDKKCSAIDNLLAKKEQYLLEIENYKQSLIYEYVTGKKEVTQVYKT